MVDTNVSKIVDQLLEGKELSKLLSCPANSNLIGKKISGVPCHVCAAEDSLIITDVLEEDQGFYTVTAKCLECDDPVELEIVLKDNTKMITTDEAVEFDGKVFAMCNEGGIMNGNYAKFNNGTKAFISKDENGNNIITFTPPSGDDFKQVNTKVTYKVISFRNNMAKIISMTNDNANKLNAGEIFFVDKQELQQNAKFTSPRANSAMAGRFKY